MSVCIGQQASLLSIILINNRCGSVPPIVGGGSPGQVVLDV